MVNFSTPFITPAPYFIHKTSPKEEFVHNLY